MKNPVEALLEDDHESLGQLLSKLDSELAKPNLSVAFELLDLFWARLAVHIRAENLHLFPALANVPAASFTGAAGVPTSEKAQNVLIRLRSDHDFFMKELAAMIKVMRETVGSEPARLEELKNLRQRLIVIKERLDQHNRLEEEQVYAWPSLIFDEQTITRLCERLGRELNNLPTRVFNRDTQTAMKRRIIGFETDDEGHWRAELDCGHFQHVRHDPPLTSRPWVLTEEGRVSRIGFELDCKRCDEEAVT